MDGYRKLMRRNKFFLKVVAKDLCWMNQEAKGTALVSVEEIIYSHAVGIDSDNTAIRQWSGFQEHRKRLADLRTTLRQEAARDIRISLRRDIGRELNAKLRMVKGEQLNILLAGYFDRGKQTLEMQLLLRVNMAARFIVTTTTMCIFKCNVWFAFSIWGRLATAGCEVPRLSQCPGKCKNGQTTWI